MTIRYVLSGAKRRVHDFFGHLRHGHALDLMQSQWWSRDRLVEFQNERLRQLIRYAYDAVPAYREKFDRHGVHPSEIRDVGDLHRIPFTTRDELRNNPGFVNRRLINETLYTGGSTGAPLRYYESFLATDIRWAAHLRGWSWNGYRPGKRIVTLASAQGGLSGRNARNLHGDLTPEKLRENARILQSFRPEYLRGYVSSLYLMARYILDNDIVIRGVRAIDPISENLYDHQRELIEQAFHADVFQEYCANDGGACGWECEHHQGLHYAMERAIIEEVDGALVTTDLWNYAMPFIRYRNGDAVRFTNQECACGRQLALIEVQGRDNDFIVTPSGTVSPSFLMEQGIGLGGGGRRRSRDFQGGISAVQYVQKPGYRLIVNVVARDDLEAEELRRFTHNLQQLLPGMRIELKKVQTLPTTNKGKRHFVINEDTELLRAMNLNGGR